MLSNLPLFTSLFPLFASIFFPFIWQFMASIALLGSFSTITVIGLILLLSDREGFYQRMKGNKMVVVLLIILGLTITAQSGIIIFFYDSFHYVGSPPNYQPSQEELTLEWLSMLWAALAVISGLTWIFHGLLVWGYREDDFTSLQRASEIEAQTKYPEDLFAKYAETSNNPSGVLEFHISQKMKEGKTREQAIEELRREIN